MIKEDRRFRPVAVGERSGRLVATRPRLPGEPLVTCVCDCGTATEVRFVRWGYTKSCGCLRRGAPERLRPYRNRPCDEPGHEREPNPQSPGTRCRTCVLARARRSAAKRHARDRQAALSAYGGVCACCTEVRDAFLAIDHIGGGGNAHRRELAGGLGKASNTAVFRWLREQGYPPGFQVLCHNCNYGKHRLGECPHETERRACELV